MAARLKTSHDCALATSGLSPWWVWGGSRSDPCVIDLSFSLNLYSGIKGGQGWFAETGEFELACAS